MRLPAGRIAEMLICSGRRHDNRGGAIGQACGTRAHPGCWDCEAEDPSVRMVHARNVLALARASGWKPGEQAESGAYPYAMCARCGNPPGFVPASGLLL